MHHKNIKPKVKYTHKRLIRPKMPKQSTKITLSVFCVGLYCWRGTCPEVWLIYPVRLQWEKKKNLIFPIQVNISSCPHPPLSVGTSSVLILYRPRACHQSEFTCPSVLLYLEESPSLCLWPSLELLVCLEDWVLQSLALNTVQCGSPSGACAVFFIGLMTFKRREVWGVMETQQPSRRWYRNGSLYNANQKAFGELAHEKEHGVRKWEDSVTRGQKVRVCWRKLLLRAPGPARGSVSAGKGGWEHLGLSSFFPPLPSRGLESGCEPLCGEGILQAGGVNLSFHLQYINLFLLQTTKWCCNLDVTGNDK